MRDILFISNGHGEDDIAGKIIDTLFRISPQPLSIDAWPMVGAGQAYRHRAIPIVGEPNLLPSSGFATLEMRLMLRDLKAGWIGTHWRQILAARGLCGRYRMAIAVGDIVPIVAAVLGRHVFAFIGCAKSSYYDRWHGYTRLEKYLLRTRCKVTFPRDRVTVSELARANVPVSYVGNPMMDGLEGEGERFGIPQDACIVAMLAGTRTDAEENLLDLLPAAHSVEMRGNRPFHFLFAVRQALDPSAVRRAITQDPRGFGWSVCEATEDIRRTGVVLRATAPGGSQLLLIKGHFADVLRIADIVVGMAGTANEQAVGLGLPLIAVPSSGLQSDNYVAMKMKFFGESAIAVRRNADEIADALLNLLADPGRRARMGRAGRERMGEPGASLAIATEILSILGVPCSSELLL